MFEIVVFVWKAMHMSPIFDFVDYQEGFCAWVWCSFWKKHKFKLTAFGSQHALTASFRLRIIAFCLNLAYLNFKMLNSAPRRSFPLICLAYYSHFFLVNCLSGFLPSLILVVSLNNLLKKRSRVRLIYILAGCCCVYK